ncbi:MAG: hypothetical protein CVV27_14125 [Candidatus Melainabacteria bacterium HGW-Melainabacteria-1]|nr:MAG: hypothetical protein CVV27_14125 [Candidatus Melainabacteria bacterium HGW-Melainabacteria-1]
MFGLPNQDHFSLLYALNTFTSEAQIKQMSKQMFKLLLKSTLPALATQQQACKRLGLLGLLLLSLSALSAASSPPAHQDLRHIKLGSPQSKATIQLELKPNEHSLLFYAQSKAKDEGLVVLEILGPKGELIYRYDEAADSVAGEHLQLGVFNLDELSFYLPLDPRFPLKPGPYSIKVKSESGQALKRAGAIVRSGAIQGKQFLDLSLWILSHNKTLHQPQHQKKYADQIRSQINRIIQPHGLQLGKVEVKLGTPAMIKAYSRLKTTDDDRIETDVCTQLAKGSDSYRQLNVGIVDAILPSPQDIANDTGENTGFALGLPGMLPLPDALWSCVLVAYDPEDEHQGGTLWHEASHLMGLSHTSEQDGLSFDPLTDTPECPAEDYDTDEDGLVDEEECVDLDATNYMFWQGNGKAMTRQQAWVLRRHPFFYPLP